MSSIKVTYFNARGRAETTRLLLAYGGIKFTDERLTGEQFGAIKASLPACQLPVIEVDGKTYCQSKAMEHYAAALVGLYPTEPLAILVNEMVREHIVDLMDQMVPILYYTPDADKKAELLAAYLKDKLPLFLARFEKIVAENGSFVYGSTTSYADIALFNGLDFLLTLKADALADYPALTALKERVTSLPQLAEYLATRA